MPEAYWSAVTTLIVMQSTLGVAWTVSKQRFFGTALGAVAGGLLESLSLLFGMRALLLVAVGVYGLAGVGLWRQKRTSTGLLDGRTISHRGNLARAPEGQ